MRRVRRTFDSRTQRQGALDDVHLRMLLAFVLRDGDNCIDIGANRGDILRMIVDYAPQGRHIAFEPLPALYVDLTQRFPNVDVRRFALSNSPGVRSFTYVRTLPSRSGFLQVRYPGHQSVEAIQVEVSSLDLLLPKDYEPRLIKIDVEGAEREVLEGAMDTIRQHQPVVVFECQRSTAHYYDTTPDDIYDLLVAQGRLRIFDLSGFGPYSLHGFRDAYALGRVFNFVAHV